MQTKTTANPLRRQIIKTLGSVAIVSPFISLVGCGSSELSADFSDENDTDTGTTSGTGTSGTGTSTTWASGGTSNMTVDFPDDSLFDSASACIVALTGAQTEGPCYFTGEYLDDISDQQTGLPMQLCLRVIDSQCNPMSGMEVEVWHCDVEGIYSGNTSGSADVDSFNSGFCTGNDRDALQSKWFRGTQVTDSNGRVNFKSCFPGWYVGRTIHIHFRVRNNNNEQVISQFCFTDAFTSEICSTHVDYINHGTQDTSVTRDNVFGSNYADYLFNVSQNEDGSLLAWKTIQIS